MGVVLATLSWLVAVPWDLSEVDASGQTTGNGADKHWLGIGAVLVVVVAAGVTAALRGRRVEARALTTAGAATWAFLFAWRSVTARAAGANMWMVPFLFIVVPVAFGVSSYVSYLARTRSAGTSMPQHPGRGPS
jgi:hypothetical protein